MKESGMNREESQVIEVFRQQLEARFRRERHFNRVKIMVGVLIAASVSALVPMAFDANSNAPTSMRHEITDSSKTSPASPAETSTQNQDEAASEQE